MNYTVTAFYNFAPLENDALDLIEGRLYAIAEATDLNGLIIMAPEGLNATVAGSEDVIAAVKKFILSIPGFAATSFKDSKSSTQPFRRFKVKRRDEIVTLGRTDLVPTDLTEGHVSPTQWNAMLSEDDVVVIDTRNTYETDLGMFRGAIDPRIKNFSDFPKWVAESGLSKDKKILMYCTGGIRCEKAYLEMKEQGFQQVFQLDGGILKYLEEYPEGEYEGECFVFDHRVAVDAHLQPSKRYSLCAHCGDPASKHLQCKRCEAAAVVCDSCLEHAERNTCSKDCAYHYSLKLSRGNTPMAEA